MHYVRFLKPPSIAKEHGSPYLKLLLTITTDLGDSFYPCNIDIFLHLWRKNQSNGSLEILLDHKFSWRPTDRQISVSLPVPNWRAPPSDAVQVILRPDCLLRSRYLSSPNANVSHKPCLVLPPVVGASSLWWNIGTVEAPRDILRPIPYYGGGELAVREESGDSIARHVWDAGQAAIACLNFALDDGVLYAKAPDTVERLRPKEFLPTLVRILGRGPRLSVIELGAGVGLVGCIIARSVPGSQVLLTDLTDAQAIAEWNAAEITDTDQLRGARQPRFQLLDWTKPLPESMKDTGFELIIATDCTYNPDYSPDLVKTISRLEEASPGVAVMIVSKTRHDSEAVFFEKMTLEQFEVIERETVLSPLDQSDEALEEAESIDIHIFSRLAGPSKA